MRIGEVAVLAGVPAATVRHYERRGLIAEVERTSAGYRRYDANAARPLRFIKHAQELGFSLKEIRLMLGLRRDDPLRARRSASSASASPISNRLSAHSRVW